MSKYYPPNYKEDAFHCLHCDVYANQIWESIDSEYLGEYHEDQEDWQVKIDTKEVEYSLCTQLRETNFLVV